MLLDKLNEKKIATLRDKYGKQPEFLPEKYSLFFQYDTAAGEMSYMAVRDDLQDETIPFGYYFSIGAKLDIHSTEDRPWFPLLLYLREYEQSL
ncbi:MAG: hypothetical protein IJS84_09210, partial [Spirochaetales bacterium]|nr:hypothetical protein [Spirochaetales bacterium]